MIQANRTFFILVGFIGAVLVAGAAVALVLRLEPPVEPPAAAFPPPLSLAPESIAAKAAILYDPASRRILFSKNSGEPLPLASLTKLMAAETVLSSNPAQTDIIITQEALRSEGDSGLIPGETWPLRELLLYGLVASSNDAMAAAVGSLGEGSIDAMNRIASRLGLTQTYFLNPTGLDLDLEVSGAYGSARDVAILASAFMREHPEYFEATARPTVLLSTGSRIVEATSTAVPLQSIPGFIGAKTGYTDLAGGNLVAAFDLTVGRPVIAVVLGSTREGRFADMNILIAAAHAALAEL